MDQETKQLKVTYFENDIEFSENLTQILKAILW